MPLKFRLFFMALAVWGLCSAPAAAASRARAEAKLIDLRGKPVGRAVFQQMARGVMIEIEASGLPPGPHAVMIHTTGACHPQKGFYTAGPDLDFDPPRAHGFLVTGGPRPGDLPNQFAHKDGSLHASVFSHYFTLGGGKKSLFDRDGASIVIHEKADDYRSQPNGNAGARLVCGTIVRTHGPKPRKPRAEKKKK